ncbi:choline transport protein [Mycena olivaceomarginata]|nr:choline transport protein [Mycena olivaceomarginata]
MADGIMYPQEKGGEIEKNAQEYAAIVTSREAGTGRINAWVALGGSITVAVANGGAPGIIYEFLAACVYYGFVATSIAELASSIPSAGGVYHWASVAGLINFYGWIFDLAAIVTIPANVAVQMYVVFHPDFVVQVPVHVFLAFVLINWFCCLTVIFFNRFMPALQKCGLFMIVVGGLVTIILPNLTLPASFVFTDWQNATGWSGGVAFLTGMLNGAFAIGTPDSTGFVYAVALMFAITDLDAVLHLERLVSTSRGLCSSHGDKGGTSACCLSWFVSIMICSIGTYITVGRIYWALARDNLSVRLSCPVPATLFCGKHRVLTTAFGAIQLGNLSGFISIILTTHILCHGHSPRMFSLAARTFHRARSGWAEPAFSLTTVSVLLIVFTNVMFCFPYALPATVPVILVGCVVLTTFWWVIHGIHPLSRTASASFGCGGARNR